MDCKDWKDFRLPRLSTPRGTRHEFFPLLATLVTAVSHTVKQRRKVPIASLGMLIPGGDALNDTSINIISIIIYIYIMWKPWIKRRVQYLIQLHCNKKRRLTHFNNVMGLWAFQDDDWSTAKDVLMLFDQHTSEWQKQWRAEYCWNEQHWMPGFF